jgi:Tol biopolymer transport system component
LTVVDQSIAKTRRGRFLWWLFYGMMCLLSPIALCIAIVLGIKISYDLGKCPLPLRQTLHSVQQRIVFSSNRDGNNEIYIMNADGSNQTNLTQNPADDHTPVVSPNGTQIAFVSNRTGNYQIYVINTDGTQVTNLSRNNQQDGSRPSGGELWISYRKPLLWTHDGKQIIFGASDDQFYTMDADGSNRQHLRDFRAPFPEPSPDGKLVAFLDNTVKSEHGSGPVLVVENADGSSRHQFTDPSASNVLGFNWSPDSQQVAYPYSGRILISRADGSESRVIWDAGQFGPDVPTWSLDGQFVAFHYLPNRGRDSREEGLEHKEIYVAPVDGSGACLLTSSLRYDDWNPSWAH